MKIAIVGTSLHLNGIQEMDLTREMTLVMKKFPQDTLIISGGAVGVDTMAKVIAEDLGFPTKIYSPEVENWEHYKKRNIEIAEECDEIYCFTIPVRPKNIAGRDCYHHSNYSELEPHEKTAGCWTGEHAKKLGKKFNLVVVSR